jgi:UDP-N-acetylmuramyl pentapeptide phosphotransferase/UDP-N-acetylglucosamine-1-phosphate transferase
MYDGINGQVGILSLTIFLYFLLNNFMPMFSILLIISLLFFLFLNIKGKIFMGDSGCYVLSFVMIYFFLRFYNFELIKLDEAFLFFFLPIVDTLRLFINRIFTSGQPWKADADHMHHLITNKFNLNIALLSQYILSLCLILLVTFTDINNLFLIFLTSVIYFTCLFKLKKN